MALAPRRKIAYRASETAWRADVEPCELTAGSAHAPSCPVQRTGDVCRHSSAQTELSMASRSFILLLLKLAVFLAAGHIVAAE